MIQNQPRTCQELGVYAETCELLNVAPVSDDVAAAWLAVKTAEVTRAHGVIIDIGMRHAGNKLQLKSEIGKELKRIASVRIDKNGAISEADVLPAVWARAQGAMKFKDR